MGPYISQIKNFASKAFFPGNVHAIINQCLGPGPGKIMSILSALFGYQNTLSITSESMPLDSFNGKQHARSWSGGEICIIVMSEGGRPSGQQEAIDQVLRVGF